jgi:hypothetical protein
MLWSLISISWTFWLGLIIGVIFILWLFYGGKNHKFVGIDSLAPGKSSISDSLLAILPSIKQPKIPAVSNETSLANVRPAPEQKQSPACQNDDQAIETDVETKPTVIQVIPIKEPEKKIDKTPYIPPEVLQQAHDGKPVWAKKESQGEKMCRQAAEKVFGVAFTKVRPDWLKNPETGRNLELDCYNDELKIAIEYNGEQHYKFPNGFMRGQDGLKKFYEQLRRDDYKVKMCDANGVYLITVPYTIPEGLMAAYIEYYSPENVQARIDKMGIMNPLESKEKID